MEATEAIIKLFNVVCEKDRAVEARFAEVLRREEHLRAREERLRSLEIAVTDRMERCNALQSDALTWKARAAEAQRILKDEEVVARRKQMLDEYAGALNERESKIQESWDAWLDDAKDKSSSMHHILSGIRRDAKVAEEIALTMPNAPCAACARHETRLQRWAAGLALESRALKARADRLTHEEAQFKEEISASKANRKATEALLEEIKSRELELERAFAEVELREGNLDARFELADSQQKDLGMKIQNVDAHEMELASREKAVKELERLWNDRYQDLVAREEATSRMQRRMAQQRHALETREADLLDGEERTRVELVELAAKRTQLRELEALLDRKQTSISEREFDADTLLGEAEKERELIREFESVMEAKFGRLVTLAMELEAVKENTTVNCSSHDIVS